MSATFGVAVRPISAGGGGLPAVAPMPAGCGEWLGCSAGDVRIGVFGPAWKALGDAAREFGKPVRACIFMGPLCMTICHLSPFGPWVSRTTELVFPGVVGCVEATPWPLLCGVENPGCEEAVGGLICTFCMGPPCTPGCPPAALACWCCAMACCKAGCVKANG